MNCSCRPVKHQCIPKIPLARIRSPDRGSFGMLILLVHLRCSGPDFILGHELERSISVEVPGKDFCFHFEIDLHCSLKKAVFGKPYLSLRRQINGLKIRRDRIVGSRKQGRWFYDATQTSSFPLIICSNSTCVIKYLSNAPLGAVSALSCGVLTLFGSRESIPFRPVYDRHVN